MFPTRSLALALTATLVAAGAPLVHATSADNAAARVVVPFVRYNKATTSLVFVENHELRNVEVQLRWVGERTSGSPGLRICGKVIPLGKPPAPPGRLPEFDSSGIVPFVLGAHRTRVRTWWAGSLSWDVAALSGGEVRLVVGTMVAHGPLGPFEGPAV